MVSGEGSDNLRMFSFLQERKERLSSLTDSDQIRLKHFTKFTSKGFSNCLSRLFQWLEEWLVIEQVKREKYEREVRLVRAYNERGLYGLADRLAARIEEKISKNNKLNSEEASVLSQLYKYQYYSDNPIKYKSSGLLFQKLIDQFLSAHKERALIFLAELHNWGRVINYDFSDSIDRIRESVEKIPDSNLIPVLNELENLVTNHDLNAYQKLKDTLFSDKISRNSELHTILTFYLITHSLILWTNGKIKEPNELVEIYEYGLNTGVLMIGGKIPLVRFYNILSTLGAIKSFEWSEAFIDRWNDKVYTNHIESTKALALAQNCFYHKRYEEIIPLIRMMEYDDFSQKIRAGALTVVALYMQPDRDYEILNVYASNYKRLLKRHKKNLGEQIYKSHLSMVEIVELLIKRERKRITIDLNKYPSIHLRNWVTEQVNQATS